MSNYGGKDIEELLDVEVKLRKIKQEKAIRERQQSRDVVCEVHEVIPRFPYPQGPREYQRPLLRIGRITSKKVCLLWQLVQVRPLPL